MSSNVQLTINSHKILKNFNNLCSNKYGVNNVIWMVSNHNLSINGLCCFEAYTVMIVSIAWTQPQPVVNEVLAHLLLILDLLLLLLRRISTFPKSEIQYHCGKLDPYQWRRPMLLFLCKLLKVTMLSLISSIESFFFF